MSAEALIPPSEFAGIDGVAHLCTGGESPWLRDHDEVYARFARDKGAAEPGREAIMATAERCRERVGTLWDVPAQRIAFATSAADAMGWLARGIDWRDGDNVVTDDIEFPSVGYAWRDLPARGVEVRAVAHGSGFALDEGTIADAIDARTRVVSVSQVSFFTGQHLDLEPIAAAARRHGALLALDATHASGVLPVPATLTDLCVSSAYKWMLATGGVAPCYLSEAAERHAAPAAFGWRNLETSPPGERPQGYLPEVTAMPKRLEPGNPAWLPILFLDAALERLLGLGAERTAAHATALSARVRAGLAARGLVPLGPDDARTLSGNTCFAHPDGAAIARALARDDVLVWNGHGRVRVSCHVHNDAADVDRLLDALDRVAAAAAD